MLFYCLFYSSTLKMESTCSSENSVDFRRITSHYIPTFIIYKWLYAAVDTSISWNLEMFAEVKIAFCGSPVRVWISMGRYVNLVASMSAPHVLLLPVFCNDIRGSRYVDRRAQTDSGEHHVTDIVRSCISTPFVTSQQTFLSLSILSLPVSQQRDLFPNLP
jgi:hypothetical protein